MRLFAWIHLKTLIPDDWEMLLYSLDPRFGTVELATRAGVQARITWKPASKKDMKQLGAWVWDEEDTLSASRFDPVRRVMLTWSFPATSKQMASAVVDACEIQEGGSRLLTLYGIHARFPSGFSPEALQVHPANHMLSLTGPKESRMVYRRWGLPDQILMGESIPDFYTKLLKAENMSIQSQDRETLWGRDVDRLSFTSRGLTPWQRILFRRVPGKAWIWLDETCNRLCALEQMGPSTVNFPHPEKCFDVR